MAKTAKPNEPPKTDRQAADKAKKPPRAARHRSTMMRTAISRHAEA